MKTAFFLCVATAVAQNQTGGVTGVVVDSVSHQPVKKAVVSLNQMMGAQGNQPRAQGAPMAITDASGAFSFANAPVGQAQISVQHSSYPPARAGKAIEIKAGEIAGRVTLELIPGGVITGHVLDEDGDPLNGCFVAPHPAGNANQGVNGQGRSTSDLNGEYRIFSIPPGKYILSIDCQRPVFEARPFSAGPDPPPTRAYPSVLYPAAAEPKSAEVVDVAPGAEKSGVDFRMTPAAVTQIRGSFSGDGWRGRQNLSLQLVNADAAKIGRFGFGSSIDSTKGTFEFHKVFPGSYTLAGFSNDGDPENRIGVMQRVEVKDQPLETILEWRRAVDLSGTIQMELQGSQTISPNQITIQLAPAFPSGLPFTQGRVQGDGSFTVKSVLPSLWRIQAQGPQVFIKAAWMGNDEITDRPLDLTAGAAGSLRIVVSNNTATIRGNGPAGQMLFMQPVDEYQMSLRSTGTQINPNGQYTLSGLAPGKYRLVVSDPMSPVFGGPADEGGKEVTVKEGETVTVDLKN